MSELFSPRGGQVGTIVPLNTIESDIALLSSSWISNVPSCLRAFVGSRRANPTQEAVPEVGRTMPDDHKLVPEVGRAMPDLLQDIDTFLLLRYQTQSPRFH